jgi:hypothetical protein
VAPADARTLILLRSPDAKIAAGGIALRDSHWFGADNTEAAMKRHRFAQGLLAGGMSILALAGGAGVARAQPAPTPPPVPSIIDQLLTSTPALSVDPSDEGGPSSEWGGVGMFCLNLWVRCR